MQPALPVNRRKPRSSAAVRAAGVAIDPGVEPGRRRDERAHVGGERLHHRDLGHGWCVGEGEPELIGKGGIRFEPPQNDRPVAAHLVGGLDRHAHLRLQRGRTTIPEELLAPGQIPKRRRIAAQRRAGERARLPAAVGEGALGPVATGAGMPAGAGQARVGEKLRAERDRLGREGIVGRCGWRVGPLEHLPPHGLGVGGLGGQRRCEQAQEGCQADGGESGAPARHAVVVHAVDCGDQVARRRYQKAISSMPRNENRPAPSRSASAVS